MTDISIPTTLILFFYFNFDTRIIFTDAFMFDKV